MPQENTVVEVEVPLTELQPPPPQEIEVQEQDSPKLNTLIETLAPRLTDWLSQKLRERIHIGVEAHFGPRRQVLVYAVATESGHRAVEALLDSESFLEVILEVILGSHPNRTATPCSGASKFIIRTREVPSCNT